MSLSLELLKKAKTPQQVVYCLNSMGAHVHFKKWSNETIDVWTKRRPFKKAWAKVSIFQWEEITRILAKNFSFKFDTLLKKWHGIYSLTAHKWVKK
ncbi:MAG: hypothetical protein PHT82_01925 [Candidatus Portnoybacteria bacterium]|jgi:hypothetical protein|nr:hypothetical protein [Candidatus Portnoybacteria bacterium]MDD5752271.1 hypothetical protein [Candidatus Portnoybacteria bacterium]